MVKLEDYNIITDLREINESKNEKFDTFWKYTNKFRR